MTAGLTILASCDEKREHVQMRERLFKFAPRRGRSGLIAFTYNKAGKNLPAEDAPWRLVGTLGGGAETGPRAPATCSEIFAAVEKNGYALWLTPREGDPQI